MSAGGAISSVVVANWIMLSEPQRKRAVGILLDLGSGSRVLLTPLIEGLQISRNSDEQTNGVDGDWPNRHSFSTG
jgi:hypothetical protein